jgi:hypothetical protein
MFMVRSSGERMKPILITGSGVFTPTETVSNEELVASFNQYVDLFNAENAPAVNLSKKPRVLNRATCCIKTAFSTRR